MTSLFLSAFALAGGMENLPSMFCQLMDEIISFPHE